MTSRARRGCNENLHALSECGIMARVESWFDAQGVRYEVEPKVTGCMMHAEGRCCRDYTFFFEK